MSLVSSSTPRFVTPKNFASGDQLKNRRKIGGEAGYGIKAAGQTLARCFVHGGLHTFDLTEYPSLIRGGHNAYQVRVSPDEIFSHVIPVDILVALNQETVDRHKDAWKTDTAIIFNTDLVLIIYKAQPEGRCIHRVVGVAGRIGR